MPTQSTNTSGNAIGIEYNSPSQTWKVKKGVSVSATDYGVYSEYLDSKLNNKGSIFGDDYGVYFDAADQFTKYEIYNKASGNISGSEYGIYLEDFRGSAMIENYGDISSEYGIYTYGSSYVDIINHGNIVGDDGGLYIETLYAGSKAPSVKNWGKIEGADEAVYFDDGTSLAKLTNYKGGVIRGGDYSVYSDDDPVKIKNEGKIFGDIYLYDYDDKIINKKKIVGDVELNEGDDVVKNKDKGKISGLIDSGEGNDQLTLGNKAEKLLFDSALNAADNVDRIKKFESGKDMMFLDEDYFASPGAGPLDASEFRKGTSALDADDFIIYDKKTGSLYYDADGNGAGAQIKFAQLDPKTKLVASDFEIGEFSI